MQRITIYTYKAGMASLLELIHTPSEYSTQAALNTLSLEEITLVEWRGRITPNQMLTWHHRNYAKQYPVKMPLSLAVAFWKVLRTIELNPHLQAFSDSLDKSLVDNGFSPKFLNYSTHV